MPVNDEIDIRQFEYLRNRDRLLSELLPWINDIANSSTDVHVLRWHRGFGKKGSKIRKGTVFQQCWCVPGMIRDILMKEAGK